MKTILENYETENFFDEMFEADKAVRPAYQSILSHLESLNIDDLKARQDVADMAYLTMGITFNVYNQGKGLERILPFDLLPRIITADEWDTIDRGIIQRVTALNIFLDDIYHKQAIVRDGIIPSEVIESSPGYIAACREMRPPKDRWIHISGTDLIKHTDGQYYILEDNCRVPSGVSYALQNREIMKRAFASIFKDMNVRPIHDYPLNLLEILKELSPAPNPHVVVLTPGIYNSAYFEHSFLAQQMGVELVEGRDLVVIDDCCYMHTTKGLQRVDVIYRRIDDEFLDPRVFRSDSLLGVPGLFDTYRKGNVALANAPGTGIADDKVVCAFVPDIIRYYLSEEPVLPNVPTYLCMRPEDCAHVIEHIGVMVVKESCQSGGYGMLIGPAATRTECAEFAVKIRENPRNFIAQPVMSLSRVPTLIGDRLEGRHVDLRPYTLLGEHPAVMPGGMSRVALRKGSLVVNSSQGGGSKDTWVLKRVPGESVHA